MATPDPKRFYDRTMPEKLGMDYEAARWRKNPFLAAQYGMNAATIERFVLPRLGDAHRILEVGPGPGTWTKLLLSRAPEARYTLVDISSEMLAQARAALAEKGAIIFVESDLAAFESAEPFDFFFSSRALEYMPDKEAIAARIASLLSGGGHGAIITKMPKRYFERLKGASVSSLHSGQVGPRALSKLLGDAGLSVTSIRIATATVPGLRSPAANRIAFSLLSRIPLVPPLRVFAESYLITFEKRV